MEELELAIEFLKRRAISTEKNENSLMRQLNAVLSFSEVVSVLEMVKKNEFISFYNKMKEYGHDDFK